MSSIGSIFSSSPSAAGWPAKPDAGTKNANELTDEQKLEVDKLKKRDSEVRQHEAAHVAAGGQYVRSGPTYEFQTGPDGRRYAIGGEVSLDTSPVKGDPQATINKMRAVQAAANAPADPSGQDRSVASQAAQAAAQAQMELAQQKVNGKGGKSSADNGPNNGNPPAKETGSDEKKLSSSSSPSTGGYTPSGKAKPVVADVTSILVDMIA